MRHVTMARRWITITVLTMAALIPHGRVGVAAQDGTEPLLVTWVTSDGSTFRAVVADADAIARITAAFPGDGLAGVPNGTLVAGDGGVNAPHAWHLEGITIADVTIELCDGTPAMVDADLDDWLTSVGAFCPWSAVVIAVEPLTPVVEPTTAPPAPVIPEPTTAPVEPTAPPSEPVTGAPTVPPSEPPTRLEPPPPSAEQPAVTLPNTGAGSTIGVRHTSWLVSAAVAGGLLIGGVGARARGWRLRRRSSYRSS